MAQRLFICCFKGFFREENRDELYRRLDLDRRATRAQIKESYRNMSLYMHPDKRTQRGHGLTDEDNADYIRMKHAYDVLSNPQQRELYDHLGEMGLLMMDDPFAAKDTMIKKFVTMGTSDRLRLVIFVLLFVGAMLLWPLLFCAKVDGETPSPWVVLWTPLWICDVLGLWYFMYLVGLGETTPPEEMVEGWTDPSPLPLRVVALVKWVLFIMFQLFLTLRLDEDIHWSYATLVAPLLARVALTLLVHVYEYVIARTASTTIPRFSVSLSDAEKRRQATAKRSEARWALIKDCVWIVQLVFLMVQLDEQVDLNWWILFMPTWVMVFGQLAGSCIVLMRASKLTSGIGEDDDNLTDEDRTRIEGAIEVIIKSLTSCCCWSIMLITAILVVADITESNFTTYVIFIPQFVVAGLFMCCVTCMICCVRDNMPEEDSGDLEEGGRVSTRPHHVPTSYDTYGTYSPLSTSKTGGVNASASSAENSASSPNGRPAQDLTPDPEHQADGGID